MTPHLKFLLRRRNSLLRRGRHGAADALASKINDCIITANATTFQGLERGSRRLWAEVRRLREGETVSPSVIWGVTCETLNLHYQNVSTDLGYIEPLLKLTANLEHPVDIDEYVVFKGLESSRGSSVGPDGIPSWLLSTMAHLLSAPVTYLFNSSLASSYTPPQWRSSCITPVPKNARPQHEVDFRPISITPVLCRLLEKIVVRRYFYPIFTDLETNLVLDDQYAFRPSGSTTSALIALTHKLSCMLQEEPYVRLISLDFSRAFDTVRHSYFSDQLALLP